MSFSFDEDAIFTSNNFNEIDEYDELNYENVFHIVKTIRSENKQESNIN